MADVTQWAFVARDFAAERLATATPRERAGDHPLAPRRAAPTVRRSSRRTSTTKAPEAAAPPPPPDDPLSAAVDDPLSAMLDDPLSAFAAEAAKPPPPPVAKEEAPPALDALSVDEGGSARLGWPAAKRAMLDGSARDGPLRLRLPTTLYPSYAKGSKSGAELEDDSHETTRSAPKSVDRSAARLRQLETPARRASGAGCTAEGYGAHVDALKAQLHRAWANDERVLALKLAIAAAKLLGSVDEPGFYPEQFVKSADLLDRFGSLVHDRIAAKAAGEGPNTGPDAAETCRNWFYKTACIRELLPRFYVECALLKCYCFLGEAPDWPAVLGRLAATARGLGDPLVAAYARCYLAKTGAECHEASTKAPALRMLQDHLFCFREVRQERFQATLVRLGVSDGEYLRLCEPAVAWVLKVLGAGADRTAFEQVLSHYKDHCNDAGVLRRIVEGFDAAHCGHHAVALVNLAKRAEPSPSTSTVRLLAALGASFGESPPPAHVRLPVLNEVWRVATRCTDLDDYVACATSWLDCILKHYSDREVKVLLADVLRHVDDASASEEAGDRAALENLVALLVRSCAGAGARAVLGSDRALKLLDAFRPGRRVEIAKELLASCGGGGVLDDPSLVHSILEVGRVAHDALDALSADGERAHVASLLIGILDNVDFGRDVEQQLGVLVECRGAFHRLDAVLDRVVMDILKLAMRCRRLAGARGHSDRTLGFAKACLAACHVTIPSLTRVFRRLRLLGLAGQVALLNGLLPHADACFKGAVQQIPDAPGREAIAYDGSNADAPTEDRLVEFSRQFCGALVCAPGHPEHGPFYLVLGLLNALPRYKHWRPHTGAAASALLAAVPLLGSLSQRRAPYAIPGVDGNDVLYGGAPEYLEELRTHLGTAVNAVVAVLTALGKPDARGSPPSAPQLEKRAELALDLVNALLPCVAVGAGSDAGAFAAKLVGLAAKHKETRALKAYHANTAAALAAAARREVD